MLNHCEAIGRLTRDPDIRYSQGESLMEVARFSLAVKRKKEPSGNAQSVDFIPCVAFGKTAEICEKYLHKGMLVAVQGLLISGSYINNSKKKVYTLNLCVNEVDFLERKRECEAEEQGMREESDESGYMDIDGNEYNDEPPFQQ